MVERSRYSSHRRNHASSCRTGDGNECLRLDSSTIPATAFLLNHESNLLCLSVLWDNKTELDAEIARRKADIDKAEREAGESPFVARLKAERPLP